MNKFHKLLKKAQDELDREVATGNARHLRNMVSFLDRACQEGVDKDDPNLWGVFVSRSYGHFYLGELEKALDDLKWARDMNSEEYSIYVDLATVYDDLGDLRKANRYSIRALQLNPDDAEAYANYAAILDNQGLHGSCIAVSQEAIDRDPHNFIGYANRAIGQLHMEGSSEAVIADLEKAITLAPRRRTAGLYPNLASAHEAAGSKEEAEKYYRHALSLVCEKEEQDLTTRDYYTAIASERGLRKLGIDPGTDFEKQGLESGMVRREVIERRLKDFN